jgi:hypothetical protein
LVLLVVVVAFWTVLLAGSIVAIGELIAGRSDIRMASLPLVAVATAFLTYVAVKAFRGRPPRS